MHSKGTRIALLLLLAGGLPLLSEAADYGLVIQSHRFQRETLRVPAEQRVKLVIDNRDASPEEFESHDLRREKVIPGNSQASLWLGPLPKGEYQFYGEFHQSTAQGKLIAE